MTSYAITVVGHDRPGIIADVTGALADHGGNIEDSTMSLLRGHFAWTLIVGCDVAVSEIDSAVEMLRRPDLMISVLEVPQDDRDRGAAADQYWLTVHGSDRPGIVSAITRVIADVDGNLTNLTTRLAGGLYVVGADVDLPTDTDIAALTAELDSVAHSIGVTAALRAAETDDL